MRDQNTSELASDVDAHSLQRLVRLGAAIHQLGRERREVRVMAIAEGYAMVRRKGMMPYICDVKELTQPNSAGELPGAK